MERMKVEIDSEELKKLKSREEKYLAYMDMLSYRWEDKTYVDALCWKVAELEEENKKLKEENEELKDAMKELNNYNKFRIQENKKLREELSAYDREYFDEDKKAKYIYKNQKENILMWKIC